MKPASALTPTEKKFMLSHPEWFKLIRRPLFIAVTFLVLAAFAVFLLRAGRYASCVEMPLTTMVPMMNFS